MGFPDKEMAQSKLVFLCVSH